MPTTLYEIARDLRQSAYPVPQEALEKLPELPEEAKVSEKYLRSLPAGDPLLLWIRLRALSENVPAIPFVPQANEKLGIGVLDQFRGDLVQLLNSFRILDSEIRTDFANALGAKRRVLAEAENIRENRVNVSVRIRREWLSEVLRKHLPSLDDQLWEWYKFVACLIIRRPAGVAYPDAKGTVGFTESEPEACVEQIEWNAVLGGVVAAFFAALATVATLPYLRALSPELNRSTGWPNPLFEDPKPALQMAAISLVLYGMGMLATMLYREYRIETGRWFRGKDEVLSAVVLRRYLSLFVVGGIAGLVGYGAVDFYLTRSIWSAFERVVPYACVAGAVGMFTGVLLDFWRFGIRGWAGVVAAQVSTVALIAAIAGALFVTNRAAVGDECRMIISRLGDSAELETRAAEALQGVSLAAKSCVNNYFASPPPRIAVEEYLPPQRESAFILFSVLYAALVSLAAALTVSILSSLGRRSVPIDYQLQPEPQLSK